jgi:hypothetical protein
MVFEKVRSETTRKVNLSDKENVGCSNYPHTAFCFTFFISNTQVGSSDC